MNEPTSRSMQKRLSHIEPPREVPVAYSFVQAIHILHEYERKLGRFVRLQSGRWVVVPLPQPELDRAIGFIVEVK